MADAGYRGMPGRLVSRVFGWLWQTVARDRASKGFAGVARRWIAERTFGWFEGFRRLSEDDETLPATSESVVERTLIRLALNRLP